MNNIRLASISFGRLQLNPEVNWYAKSTHIKSQQLFKSLTMSLPYEYRLGPSNDLDMFSNILRSFLVSLIKMERPFAIRQTNVQQTRRTLSTKYLEKRLSKR